jgi:transcription antitermination factor NusG
MFRWYVINTYSGHENKVKQNLEHRVVSLSQQRAVRQVVVPTETVQEMKDNQKVAVEKRTMPGYVLVNMDLNEDSWSLVKNTPGVTGFVGASNEPIPLTQSEVDRLLHREVAVRAPSRALCQTSPARSPRSTRTPPGSRSSSRSSVARPRSRSATTRSRRSNVAEGTSLRVTGRRKAQS